MHKKNISLLTVVAACTLLTAWLYVRHRSVGKAQPPVRTSPYLGAADPSSKDQEMTPEEIAAFTPFPEMHAPVRVTEENIESVLASMEESVRAKTKTVQPAPESVEHLVGESVRSMRRVFAGLGADESIAQYRASGLRLNNEDDASMRRYIFGKGERARDATKFPTLDIESAKPLWVYIRGVKQTLPDLGAHSALSGPKWEGMLPNSGHDPVKDKLTVIEIRVAVDCPAYVDQGPLNHYLGFQYVWDAPGKRWIPFSVEKYVKALPYGQASRISATPL